MSLREQLHSIYKQRGELTPSVLVDEARPDGHPLHHRFEWDDAVAGEKYRETQAAHLIRSVKITYATDTKGRESTVRAFVAVRGEEDLTRSAYMPTEQALADPFTAAILLRDCKRELDQLTSKYGHLKGYAALLTEEAESA